MLPRIGLLRAIVEGVLQLISDGGYVAIGFLMALESALMPVPSEVVMPFAGYLAYLGVLSLTTATIAGSIGNLIGSLLAYYAGLYGGRRFVEKYGRYLMLSRRHLRLAEEFFSRYGSAAVLISRMLPVIRTVIAFPAGVGRMNLARFSLSTLVGSLPWCYALAYSGYRLGPYWSKAMELTESLELVILLAAPPALYLIYRTLKAGSMEEDT